MTRPCSAGGGGGSARDASVAPARSSGASTTTWRCCRPPEVPSDDGLLISTVKILLISSSGSLDPSRISFVTRGHRLVRGYIETVLDSVIPLVPILVPYPGEVLLLSTAWCSGPDPLVVGCTIPTTISGQAVWQLARQDFSGTSWRLCPSPPEIWPGRSRPTARRHADFALSGLPLATFVRRRPQWRVSRCCHLLQAVPISAVNHLYRDARRPSLPAEVITLTSGRTVVG